MSADLVAAQRRSDLAGIDPGIEELPLVGDPGPASTTLRDAIAPMLDQLVSHAAGTSLAVVLADREGRVLHRDAAASTTLATMDQRCIDVGFSLAESHVGTNGVGTSLETKLPAVVSGADHYLHSLRDFTCANAPIIDPITHRLSGTVGVLCPVDDTGPLLLATVVQLASQIGRQLLERATPHERFLLEEFLRHRRSRRRAIATIGDGVLIANPAAQELLIGTDHAGLWKLIDGSVSDSGSAPTDIELEKASGSTLHLRCRPVHRTGELGGAIVEILTEPGTRRRPHSDRLGHLIGVSPPWQALVAEARTASWRSEPLLIAGERGTGRLSIATAIAERDRSRRVSVFDSASVLVTGQREWLVAISEALSSPATVIVRRIDQLDDPVAAALASAVAVASPEARLIATTSATSADEPGRATLLDRVDVLRIDVPPLRERRADIEPLARHLAAGLGHPRIDAAAIGVLHRQSWPGNVTELEQAVRAARARAANDPIGVRHLSHRFRDRNQRTPIHGLRQQEAGAIEAALRTTSTRSEAAELLGISRATLYRRIAAYGLDPG